MKTLIVFVCLLVSSVTFADNIYLLNHLNLDGGLALNGLLTEINHEVTYCNEFPSGSIDLNGLDIFIGFNGNPYYGEPSMPVEEEIFVSNEIIPLYDSGCIHVILFGKWNVDALLGRGNVYNPSTLPMESATEIGGTAYWMSNLTIGYNEDPLEIPSIGVLYPEQSTPGFNLASTNVGPPGPCATQQVNSMNKSFCYNYWDPSKARDGQNTVIDFIAEWIYGLELRVHINPADPKTIPNEIILCQNYPNPFNPSTNIDYSLPSSSHVSIIVYDVLGRKVETLLDGNQVAGYHQVIWNASNVSSGVYFYRITAGENAITKRMLMLK